VATNYLNERASAKKDIYEEGAPITVRESKTSYNAFTGEASNTDIDYSTYGIFTQYKRQEIDNQLIKRNDFKLIIPVEDTFDIDSIDLSKLSIIYENETWHVIDIKSLRPGGINIIHSLQIRKQ